MLPFFFRQQRVLARLNVLGVPLSLAAATSSFFGLIAPELGIISAATTFVVGLLWVIALRSPTRVGPVRLGWVLSIPLAMLNAGASVVAMGLFDRDTSVGSVVSGFFIGITVGAFFWAPALVATLLFFGAPIAWAQRLSKQGLAGEQRGEILVGLSSFLVAAVTLLVTRLTRDVPVATAAVWTSRWLAMAGALLGSFAGLFALTSESRRRSFVARVEAGEIPHFRVATAPEGKVLLRTSDQDEDYRVADFEEELALLDGAGRTRKILVAGERADDPSRPPR